MGMVGDVNQVIWCVAWKGSPRLGRKMVAPLKVKNQNQKIPACRGSQPDPGLPCFCGKMPLLPPPPGPWGLWEPAAGRDTALSPSTLSAFGPPSLSYVLLCSLPSSPTLLLLHPLLTLFPSFCSYPLGGKGPSPPPPLPLTLGPQPLPCHMGLWFPFCEEVSEPRATPRPEGGLPVKAASQGSPSLL